MWEDYAEASRLKKCEAEVQKGISQAKDKAPVESFSTGAPRWDEVNQTKMSSHVNQLGHQVTFTSSSYTEFPGCPMTLDSQKKTGIFLMELFSEINFCWQYMTEKTKIYLQPSHVTTWILPVNPEICLLGWKASKKMQ